MTDLAYRRVVTGLDADGKSCVIIDGPIPKRSTTGAELVWRTNDVPADNSGTADAAVAFTMEHMHAGSTFLIWEFPAGGTAAMHATDTIDYMVILSGRVTLTVERGEVDLGPGDFIVDRGVMHGWRNPHAETCVAAIINLPAQPVGNGRTV